MDEELKNAARAARFAHETVESECTGNGILGSARVIVDLIEDRVTVFHGTDNVKLAQLDAGGNDAWKEIWATFDRLGFVRLVKE